MVSFHSGHASVERLSSVRDPRGLSAPYAWLPKIALNRVVEALLPGAWCPGLIR